MTDTAVVFSLSRAPVSGRATDTREPSKAKQTRRAHVSCVMALCVSLSRSISAGGSPRSPPGLCCTSYEPLFFPTVFGLLCQRLSHLPPLRCCSSYLCTCSQGPEKRPLMLLPARALPPAAVRSDWLPSCQCCCLLSPCFLQHCVVTGCPPAAV